MNNNNINFTQSTPINPRLKLEDGETKLAPKIFIPSSKSRWLLDKWKRKNEEVDDVKKKKWPSLPIVAILMVLYGLTSYLANPVELIQEWSMRIAPGTRYLDIWMNPPLNVYAKVYIFNVTNPEAFLLKKEKMKLQEIGPFVYKEVLMHRDVVFNGNNTMTYTPRRKVEFQRHLSVADPRELNVTVPNIALLALGSMLADSTIFANLGLVSTIRVLGSKPFLNMPAYDYLWGYDDPLVKVANTLVSNWIPFAKLGILDRMYDEGKNVITVRLDDNGLPVTHPGYLPQYSIETYNGSPGLREWGYNQREFEYMDEATKWNETEKCKLIRGGTEGILFPRHLDTKIRSYVYRKTFCRHMPIEFKKEASFMPGITGHWYGMPDNVLDTPQNNPEQLCYCNPKKQKCLPNGLSDITPCYYNIPAAVSFPHFYNGDPSLLEEVEGLSPNKEKHSSYAVIQPDLGSIIDFVSRIQTNLVIKNIRYSADLIPFANMKIPFFWCELVGDGLPLDALASLYALLVILPAMNILAIALGSISAIYLIILLILFGIRRFRSRRNQSDFVPTFVPSSPG